MQRLITLLTISFVLLYASGCATIPVQQTKGCFGFKVITPTENDATVISNHLAKQILAHDTHGESIKCWKKELR